MSTPMPRVVVEAMNLYRRPLAPRNFTDVVDTHASSVYRSSCQEVTNEEHDMTTTTFPGQFNETTTVQPTTVFVGGGEQRDGFRVVFTGTDGTRWADMDVVAGTEADAARHAWDACATRSADFVRAVPRP